MAVVEGGAGDFWEITRMAQNVGSWLAEGPKRLLSDVDATSDFLKLVRRVNDIFRPIFQMLTLQSIANGMAAFTDFVDARSFIGTISDLISGKAAWEKPLSAHFPNVFKVASKLAFLVGDLGVMASWLSSVHVLGAWVKSSTAQIVSWGKEFNILDGIGDVSCITGSLLSLADTMRIVLQEVLTGGYFENGCLKLSLLTDRFIDIASDISNIAASILVNIPGVPSVMSLVALAVGSTLSLGRFFKQIDWNEPESIIRKEGPSKQC
jgi:hypothetical protein